MLYLYLELGYFIIIKPDVLCIYFAFDIFI